MTHIYWNTLVGGLASLAPATAMGFNQISHSLQRYVSTEYFFRQALWPPKRNNPTIWS